MWKHFAAITKDLKNYIDAWPDIKTYNTYEFAPHGFFTTDLVQIDF